MAFKVPFPVGSETYLEGNGIKIGAEDAEVCTWKMRDILPY